MNLFEKNIEVYLEAYDIEKLVFSMGNSMRKRGYLTGAEFYTICTWKSRRPKNLYKLNTNAKIKAITLKAFKQKDEKLKIETLCELSGVKIPTASAILSVYDPNKYPIIDRRCIDALNELKLINWTHISANSWIKYLDVMNKIQTRTSMSPRNIDKALFAYNRMYLDKEFKNLYKKYYH